MFLLLQIGFSFVKAAVALAILERTSGLEPSSETFPATSVPKYLTCCISHCCIVGGNHDIDAHILISDQ